jgi:hypothetical protein
MQITDRDDLEDPLLSPKLPRLTWGYDLVSQVQPGDRVLHWRADARMRGLVGWSEVEEHATVIPEFRWRPHQGGGVERTTPGWSAVLGPFHAFASPVTADQLLPILEQIVAVDRALSARHKGRIYFPITRYGAGRPVNRQEVRAVQAYFTKFPVELFDVIPGINSWGRTDTLSRERSGRSAGAIRLSMRGRSPQTSPGSKQPNDYGGHHSHIARRQPTHHGQPCGYG